MESPTIRVPRVCVNFAERCNMSCSYCYIPFDGVAPNLEEAKQVVNRLHAMQAESITFGGGDPLIYDWFVDLLRYTRSKFGSNMFIQLDINGLSFQKV